MKTSRLFTRFALTCGAVALFALSAAAPLAAASRSANDLLSLVPADAAAVAVVRLSELRESPLAARLFSGADHMTVDGDGARFLAEAQLDPKKDVDTVVVAGSPSSGHHNSPTIALFEGRFDPDRLAAAAEKRGATRKSTAAGTYFLLPEKHGHGDEQQAAAAFVSPSLVIVGAESAVAQALEDRQHGGTGFVSGTGLGRQLRRVDRDSSVWALVDVARYPSVARRSAHVHGSDEAAGEPAMAIMGAMKSVTLLAVQAKAHGDARGALGDRPRERRRDAAAPRGLAPWPDGDVEARGPGQVAGARLDAAQVHGLERQRVRLDSRHAVGRVPPLGRGEGAAQEKRRLSLDEGRQMGGGPPRLFSGSRKDR